MSPKYVDKKQKSKEITCAALRIFSRKGYAAASVDLIAHEAGVAKGTVYEYFPSKDQLYIAAIMVFGMEFEKAMAERLAPVDDPFLRVIEYVGLFVEYADREQAANERTMFDLLQQTLLEDGVFAKRKHLVREMMKGPRKILTDILLEGVSRRVFHPHVARSAEALAINILAYLDGILIHRLITENYINITDQLTLWMKLMTDFLLITPNEYNVDALITQAVGR